MKTLCGERSRKSAESNEHAMTAGGSGTVSAQMAILLCSLGRNEDSSERLQFVSEAQM